MSESDRKDQDHFSRRKALKIIVGSAGAAVSLPLLQGATPPGAGPACHMVMPQTAMPAAYKPQFFIQPQIQTLEALSETIIPADEHSPGAKAARVWEYIDDLVADSGETAKSLWTQGLAAIDQMAELRYGRKFAACAAEEQTALLDKISRNEERPSTPEEKFFVEIKKATIDGYYTSAIGIHQDLEYQGNSPQAEFEGCTHPEHKA